jgi:hypothetical protein
MIMGTKEPNSKLSTYMGQILDVFRNLTWIKDLSWPPSEMQGCDHGLVSTWVVLEKFFQVQLAI